MYDTYKNDKEKTFWIKLSEMYVKLFYSSSIMEMILIFREDFALSDSIPPIVTVPQSQIIESWVCEIPFFSR